MRTDVQGPRGIHAFGRDFLECSLDLDSGVGMQNIEATVLVDCLFESGLKRGIIGDIQSHRGCRVPFAGNGGSGIGGEVSVFVCYDNMGTAPRHGDGAGTPDTRSGRSHEGSLVFKRFRKASVCNAMFRRHLFFFSPRLRRIWAVTSIIREAAITIVPMALISGVTPLRIDENT